ncbi:salicylate synthase [Antrihabitans cavernicola]|uniref:Salicylate synthase n=1 Tax=Antrihabitans cavernicola TaxID=2495913 RepID=A0A5A7S6B6_9NOCA|nr:salicylate synthase [Spelaeibacter cavernicola]KAA0017974.1 salicylate synthase [Spelaeibacter cavernicola]
MSTTHEELRIEAPVDALDTVARLAASGRFAEYVVYERPGEWVFAGDTLGGVELDTDELRVSWDGQVRATTWVGRPAIALDEALASLPIGDRQAYGWIGFEFCAYTLDAEQHLEGVHELARLMVPRIEVRIDGSGMTIVGCDDAERDEIRAIVNAADGPDPLAEPVDIRADATDYRGRVATAVAEIAAGGYQKVILSRKVDLPFAVDMPATYRLGRAHNTPARSFLLRMGGLEAAGFSPELVAAVDEDGVVTTEPLAGTRAFGRGVAADSAARIDLESDPKEIVEHAVSVRTSVAEIESVAIPGTSSVSDFMTVRERGSVQHLASTVRGQLSEHHSHWEALEVLFPSVTASGIPKRESVDTIFRLDGAARGLYSGAVVTVSSEGVLEATLVLRAVYQQNGKAWLRAGAGVIEQSRPEREFEETCEKLASVSPYVVRRL